MPHLNSADTSHVQSINSALLYYIRAVDPTMIPSLNKISTYQYAPTQDTLEKFNQVLDYAPTHLNATIWYYDSDVILMTDTDTAYLVIPKSHICISGHYYFKNRMPDYYKGNPTKN